MGVHSPAGKGGLANSSFRHTAAPRRRKAKKDPERVFFTLIFFSPLSGHAVVHGFEVGGGTPAQGFEL